LIWRFHVETPRDAAVPHGSDLDSFKAMLGRFHVETPLFHVETRP
jgi:hypothetical protein